MKLAHSAPQREPLVDSVTLTLSGREVVAARRLLSLLAGPAGAGDRDGKLSKVELATLAGQILARRRRRAESFPPAMFGEAAWEMLLVLHVAEAESASLTNTRLARLTSIPASSALRWLDYLEAHELIHRKPHPHDRRAVVVTLTGKARAAFESYLSREALVGERWAATIPGTRY
jgi:DNA-binding MarR family transcriptional regulator